MSKTIALNRFRFRVLVFINCPFLQNGSQDAIDGRYIVGNLGGVVEWLKFAELGLMPLDQSAPGNTFQVFGSGDSRQSSGLLSNKQAIRMAPTVLLSLVFL